jgi:protein-disulfide isomerase
MEPQQTPETEPNKKLQISIPAAIITAAVIIALAIVFVTGTKQKATDAPAQPETPTSVPAETVTIRPTDHVRGNAQAADVLLFEYTDSDCYYCQQFNPTINALRETYGDKLAVVYRYLPLQIHPNAYTEALALECVAKIGGNDAFWKYYDTIIDVTLTPNPTSNKSLITFAADAGVSGTQLQACMEDPKSANIIDTDIAEANKIGARGTPFSILVNKKGEQIVIPGAYPLEQVKEMVDSLLK